jgi:hypothetical protein
MSRCWTRDDPVRDAEDAATDKRPILGYCAECGCEIHGGNDFYEPDDAYCIDDEYVCDDCLRTYMSRYKVE